ncbi:uncharacterized protein LOC127395595 [Apus apus]|uniref:uncharacterized protein LOC127395595 n=1 Tax=Apus apus TaxID=8895 RepID=UPI0021F8C9BE|nr:uncharacterized protein LOC127395595 [Apus apus]
MALRWTFLLVLTPLLAAQELTDPDLDLSGETREKNIFQVVPGTLEISSTSIKLNWTCRPPDTCQDIWAKCRLEDDYSSSCEAEEVKGQERLYGWKGTFTCPPLQPFTPYSVTISMPPSTILFTRIYRTKETVPDAPEDLQLDPSTGSLGWKALPSCKGEIIGYQLNITARRAQDGSFIDFQQVTVNQSVTQYTPPAQAAGSTYVVTVQGLTAAGAGPASVLEFQSYISDECQRPKWDSRLKLTPDWQIYWKNEEVMLTCPKGFQPSFTHVKCLGENRPIHSWTSVYRGQWEGRDYKGDWIHVQSSVECLEMCQKPPWDSRLQLTPNQMIFKKNEEVMLSCPEGFQPSFSHVKCAGKGMSSTIRNPEYTGSWDRKNSRGNWIPIKSNVECLALTATCQRPHWDSSLQLTPDWDIYKKNKEVGLSCPMGSQPSFTRIKCLRQDQPISKWNNASRGVWHAMPRQGFWINIQSHVECIAVLEMCQRPQWDRELQLTPDQENFKKNEEVMLSCPEGFQPSFSSVKCAGKVLSSTDRKLYTDSWEGRDIRGNWIPIKSRVDCIDIRKVVPGTLEISSTSIKLNWTCRLPDTCEHMLAMCQLAEHSSAPCEAEEVKEEERLHGQEGTFTCQSLQPFTLYSVTISLPPSTILYSWLARTEETVPDAPEDLQLDPSTGSLRWKALPSCKGEIIGYQLNITTRSAQDGAFLQLERLRLNSSVTEHPLQEPRAGSTYLVSVRGLTAAGAGAASLRQFPTNSPDAPHPLGSSCRGARDVSPSQGTAVLPLRPLARPPEAEREHQLLVAATHDGAGPALEGACSGQPQPFNASRQPAAYLAALLNLTAPTDFVLGQGARGQGYHNAALRPGCSYTALLRLVRRSHQTETFTCVCYSFSLEPELVPLLGRMHVIIGVAVVIALLALGILLLFMLFRRKYNSSKTSETSSAIPLRRCRGGVCKLNTQIPVEELLEAVKSFKRAEIEAEQTEDESDNRHGAGRLREYQQLSSTLLHSCNAGKELCNQSKNRYKSIIPCKQSSPGLGTGTWTWLGSAGCWATVGASPAIQQS